MRQLGINHALDTPSPSPSSRHGLPARPEQWFSGVTPDPLAGSDPRS